MTAPTISLYGAGFAITFPSDHSGRTHTIEIPFNMGGLKILRKALTARECESDRRIGHASSPTQAMVQEWLAEEAKQMRQKPVVMDGIDLSAIDLDL